ncbi:MAG: peptidoglycan binding domain-containing protein [Anaerotignum sp.]
MRWLPFGRSCGQAYNTGGEGTDKERFQVGAQLLKDGIDIPLEYSYDTEKMKAKLTEIAGEFDRHAVDSTVSRKNGRFVVTPEEAAV